MTTTEQLTTEERLDRLEEQADRIERMLRERLETERADD